MAARFVVALALMAMCHAVPVEVEVSREGRGYSIGQAYNSNGGVSRASANTNGDVSQAYGSSTGGSQFTRDGQYYPSQVIAKAETYDTPETVYSPAKAIAQAQNGGFYQPIIPEAVVTTYQQNFETPTLGAIAAKSSAVSDGVNDQSISTVSTNGVGNAQSSAQTKGVAGYGLTSTNTKSTGLGFGSAVSNAVNGYNSAVTSAKSSGSGSVVSNAQSNGSPAYLTPVVPSEIVEPSIIDAKKQGLPTSYIHPYVQPGYGSASSKANVNGYGSASSSAKSSNDKGVHWRFGTYYDGLNPGVYPYNGYGAAKSTANTAGYGNANANADVNSAGSTANSAANTNGYGNAKSSANTNGAGYGSANANADVNGYNNARSNANTNGFGSAVSSANTNSAGYGSAKSTANTQGSLYGGRTTSDAQTSGYGSANSSARTHGVSTAYKVADTSAKSYGYGDAQAKATSS